MLKFSSLFFLMLMHCTYSSELSLSYDDKVDATSCRADYYKNYYILDGANKLFLGTYRHAPVFHMSDAVCLLECGNKSNEVYLVTTADGKNNTHRPLTAVVQVVSDFGNYRLICG